LQNTLRSQSSVFGISGSHAHFDLVPPIASILVLVF